MATGIGNLPNPGMAFTPFDILTAEEMNMMVDNIESLATGEGIGDGSITPRTLGDSGPVTPTFTTNYTSSSLRIRKIGQVVSLYGAIVPGTGTIPGGSWVSVVGSLPLALRPLMYEEFGLSRGNSLRISASGQLEVMLATAQPSQYVGGTTYFGRA